MNYYCEFFHEFSNILERLFHTHIIDLKLDEGCQGQVRSPQIQVQRSLTNVKWGHDAVFVVGGDDDDDDHGSCGLQLVV